MISRGRLVVSALALLVLAGCDGKSQAPQGLPPAQVSVVTVHPHPVTLTTELPGRTAAARVAEVRPQVSGIILKRLFTEGAEVKAGQQLYQIDPASYEAALETAQADLAKAQASVKSAQAKAERYAALVRIKAVSAQDYDDAAATLAEDQAQVLAGEAEVRTARINLAYTRVCAPISGRIGKSAVTEGALVTAAQSTALATITQLDPIYVDLSQSSSDLLKLRRAVAAGQLSAGGATRAAVTLTLDGDMAYDHKGELKFSDVTVDAGTGGVEVRALFPNPQRLLYPGLFVRARIEEGVQPQGILVPQQSVVRNPDGSAMVWLVAPDGTAHPQPVGVGQALDGQYLIDSGLKGGDRVVVDGLQKVRPGAKVHAVERQG